jgi:hypothetical protein
MSDHSDDIVILYDPYQQGSSGRRRRSTTKQKVVKPNYVDAFLRFALRRQVLLPIFAVFVAAGTAAYQWTLAHASDNLPQRLKGVWRASLPQYAGRGFEIKDSTLTFYLGEYGKRSYTISRVHATPQRGFTTVGLDYRDASGDYALEFVLLEQGTIRFPNRDRVEWSRGDQRPVVLAAAKSQPQQAAAPRKVSPLPLALLNCIQEINREPRQDAGGSVSCASAMEDTVVAQIMVNPGVDLDDPLSVLYNVKR